MTPPPLEEQLARITRGAVDVVERAELARRLAESIESGRPLRVKLGIDPSSPDIHLGHTVVLRKLREFQALGHLPVLLWGTATAMLGDPSGRNKTRPQLSRDQVEANKRTYRAQVGRVLDMDRVEERENSEWFDRMSFLDCVALTSTYTVARLLERDSFALRFAAGDPIAVHELIYPLMQGHDSVALAADVELGGTDQLFNLMVGRELQRRAGQTPQLCLTTPLLVGLDGKEKMSKSLGNYVGVEDSATEMFGKCMSVADEHMRAWFMLLTDLPAAEIETLLSGHPREAKVALARAITADYHGDGAAAAAVAEFDRMFRQGGRPDRLDEFVIPADRLQDGAVFVAVALVEARICASNSEGRRLIEGGGVRVDGTPVQDPKATLRRGSFVVQAGKRRFARVIVP
jgi:tyrosyl-tRNA synthetase